MKKTIFVFCFAKILCFVAVAQTRIVSTVAGTGSGAYACDSGAALSCPVGGSIVGLAFDHIGNYYFALGIPGERIRKVSVSGAITTIAGTGIAGYSGDNGPATAASLNDPLYIAIDKNNNIYFSDQINCRIRKINASTNVITTVAGNGVPAYSGEGGPATIASLKYPNGICFDSVGNLYIADAGNYRIRMVDTNGIIHSYGGNGINAYSGEGGMADSASMTLLYGLCIDKNQDVVLSEGVRICKINHVTKIITRIAGTGSTGLTGDEGLADTATFGVIAHIAYNSAGDLFLSDQTGFSVIRKIDTSGYIHHVVGTGTAGFNGDGIVADTAKLRQPRGIAFDSCGDLFICDNGNYRIRKVDLASCSITTRLVKQNEPTDVSVYPNPVTSYLNISYTDNIERVSITNLLGNEVFSNSVFKNSIKVDMCSFPAGLYFLRIVDKQMNTLIKKIIKE